VTPEQGPPRAIDKEGVLLPQKAQIPLGLLTMEKTPRPKATAGQLWGDPVVERAAALADLLASQDWRARVSRLEWSADGPVLWGRDFKVLWGRQLADQTALNRLRESLDRLEPLPQGSPWLYEIDLRQTDAIVRTTVRAGG